MAAFLTLTLNPVRTELLREGWSRSVAAGSFRFQALNDAGDGWVPTSVPGAIWQEPNTGLLMLRPRVMQPDYAVSFPDAVPTDRFLFGPNTFLSYRNGNVFAVQRSSAGVILHNVSLSSALIEVLIAAAIETIFSAAARTSAPLALNEGFSVWIQPTGIFVDRAEAFFAVGFGGRYAILFQMDGSAQFYARETEEPGAPYRAAQTFRFLEGSVGHTQSYQITVIPFGDRWIGVYSSQMPVNKLRNFRTQAASVDGARGALIDLKALGYKCPWDSTLKQFRKVEPASLELGMPKLDWGMSVSVHKVAYSANYEYADIGVETLPEPKPGKTPTVVARGYEGQIAEPGENAADVTVEFRNQAGSTTWDPATDTGIVARLGLKGSTNGRYSPEVYALDYEVAETTQEPNWTPVDASDLWQTVRFDLSADMEPARAFVRLGPDPDDLANLFRTGGPIRVEISGTNVFDGYIAEKQPTIYGAKRLFVRQLECVDMWARLEVAEVGDHKSLTELGVLELVKSLIRRAGFVDGDISVTDPDSVLADMKMPSVSNSLDLSTLNDDATVADVLREIRKSVCPDLRVRWYDGSWKVYLRPEYDGTAPTIKILTDRDLATGYSGGIADTTRWTAHEYTTRGNVEVTVREPRFNRLLCTAIGSLSDDPHAVQVFKAEDDEATDETAMRFMGRSVVRRIGAAESAICQTLDDLRRLARSIWDTRDRERIVAEFAAEWNPEIEPDEFVWLITRDGAGARKSLGAWRVLTARVEATMDVPTKDQRYALTANYVCEWAGEATDGSTPMLVTDLP